MKNIASKILFTLIALAIGIWIVSNMISSQPSKIEKERVAVEKKVQIEHNILNMAVRHNSVTNWNENFNGKSVVFENIYTVQVEDALIRSDGRPVLFFASVDDVARQGNKYYVHFQKQFDLDQDIRFILECDSEQVKKIMGQKVDSFEQYAVVALISSIYRPKFEIGAELSADDERSYAEVVVESSDIFIARGRCLELLFVGNYEISKK